MVVAHEAFLHKHRSTACKLVCVVIGRPVNSNCVNSTCSACCFSAKLTCLVLSSRVTLAVLHSNSSICNALPFPGVYLRLTVVCVCLPCPQMVAGLRINNSSAWGAFDQMEEKVMALEAEAESVGMLASPDKLEAQFAMLEGKTGRSGVSVNCS